jgi:hypothetical protein
MCLIIHREPRAGHVPNDIIDSNLKRNPDGFGIAWREPDGELKNVRFAPSESKVFRKLLKSIDQQGKIEYVAHFRLATHGPACFDLSHPFAYTDPEEGEVLVFHNGVIDMYTEPTESDTEVFVRDVLSKMPPRWWTVQHFRTLVELAIDWSKLLVMTKGETVRIAEWRWSQHKGIWYSTAQYGIAAAGNASGAAVSTSYGTGWKAWASVDDKEEDAIACSVAAQVESVKLPEGWWHEGHWLARMSAEPDSIDPSSIYGTVWCDECMTSGDFYHIDGDVYFDIHEASELLPGWAEARDALVEDQKNSRSLVLLKN